MARLAEQFTMNNTCIPPKTLSNSTASSTGVSMATRRRIVYTCNPGAIPTGGALAWKLQCSETVSGTYDDISGKTAAHTDAEDNIPKIIEINSSELTSAHPFVRLFVTESGTQTCYIAATMVMEKDY